MKSSNPPKFCLSLLLVHHSAREAPSEFSSYSFLLLLRFEKGGEGTAANMTDSKRAIARQPPRCRDGTEAVSAAGQIPSTTKEQIRKPCVLILSSTLAVLTA
ncbi:hypothetical protein NE237_003314 [Protea cynaroides]|uniref:Uncharacterized protein n=1 Tax=Protea cynaroides TaxID=273540 RepID=A0A9Q0QSH3_9MAGN|nr:hypothetical protein NE237_003314 [Protea cynaroides]